MSRRTFRETSLASARRLVCEIQQDNERLRDEIADIVIRYPRSYQYARDMGELIRGGIARSVEGAYWHARLNEARRQLERLQREGKE